MSTAEFDKFAPGYSAGCDDPLKGLIGSTPEAYLEVKLDLLLRFLGQRGTAVEDDSVRFLDYGCGTGELVRLLHDRGIRWQLGACDPSDGMLRGARARHPDLARRGTFWNSPDGALPSGRYDLITAVCVLHHVDPGRWLDKLAELWAGVRPGGTLCIFEHNPRNPVTRFMVSRTPIDENAVLLDHSFLRGQIESLDAPTVEVSHLLFVPPRFKALRALDRLLVRVPWGGQYMVTATKAG